MFLSLFTDELAMDFYEALPYFKEWGLTHVDLRGRIGGKDIAGKGYAVITCCEEEDDKVLDGVTMPLKRSADLIKWNLVGEVRVTGVLKVGDIDSTDGCKQAEALAEKI